MKSSNKMNLPISLRLDVTSFVESISVLLHDPMILSPFRDKHYSDIFYLLLFYFCF